MNKIVIIGDEGIGKTSLIMGFSNSKSKEIPIVAPNFNYEENVEGTSIQFTIWDSGSSDEYKDFRIRSYNDATWFCLCFSLDSPKSIQHIHNVWFPEISQIVKDGNIIFIGLKKDKKVVTEREIFNMRNSITHRLYFECSTVSGDGINEILPTIARAINDPSKYVVCGNEQPPLRVPKGFQSSSCEIL